MATRKRCISHANCETKARIYVRFEEETRRLSMISFLLVFLVAVDAYVLGPTNKDCTAATQQDTIFEAYSDSRRYHSYDASSLVMCDQFCLESFKMDGHGFTGDPHNIYAAAAVLDGHGCMCYSNCHITSDYSQTHTLATNIDRQLIFRNDFPQENPVPIYTGTSCGGSTELFNDPSKHAPEYCYEKCHLTTNCTYFTVGSDGCFGYADCALTYDGSVHITWKSVGELPSLSPTSPPTIVSTFLAPTSSPTRLTLDPEDSFENFIQTHQDTSIRTAALVTSITVYFLGIFVVVTKT